MGILRLNFRTIRMKPICEKVGYCFEYQREKPNMCDERCGERFWKLVMKTYLTTEDKQLHSKIRLEYHL
jgi:hypothetical protein